jgi:TonB family protein
MSYHCKINLQAALAALLLHSVIIVALMLHFHWAPERNLSDAKHAPIVLSYLYEAKNSHTLTAHTNKLIHAKPLSEAIQKKTTKPSTITQRSVNKPLASAAKKAIFTNQNQHASDSLITLLHEAIQAQQQYPETALAMQRAGQATVEFTLAPDGKVSNLHLVKTSGTASLDQAAIEAVRSAGPFQHIEHYLSSTRQFQIDVIFELPGELQ